MWRILDASDNTHVATVGTQLELAVNVATKKVDASPRARTLHIVNRSTGKVAAVVTVGKVSYR